MSSSSNNGNIHGAALLQIEAARLISPSLQADCKETKGNLQAIQCTVTDHS